MKCHTKITHHVFFPNVVAENQESYFLQQKSVSSHGEPNTWIGLEHLALACKSHLSHRGSPHEDQGRFRRSLPVDFDLSSYHNAKGMDQGKNMSYWVYSGA